MTYIEKSIEIYKKVVYSYDEYKKFLHINRMEDVSRKTIWEDLHKIYVGFNKYIKENNLDSKEYELD